MKAKVKRELRPYSKRRHGKCLGKYIIKSREHKTDRMIRRRWGHCRFYGWRLRQENDYRIRKNMFRLYGFVTSGNHNKRNAK